MVGELGADRHVTKFAKNEHGTPLVNDLFAQAQELAGYDILMYSNCDMLYLADIKPAVDYAQKRFESFLAIGQRWDVDIKHKLNTKDGNYTNGLESLIAAEGSLHSVSGKDFFAFRIPFDIELPPLAIGRPGWDNYLVHHAADFQVDVVDMTQVVTAIHQNHDYSHLKGELEEFLHGPEAKQNFKLAPVPTNKGRISEAHWEITKKNYVYQAREKLV